MLLSDCSETGDRLLASWYLVSACASIYKGVSSEIALSWKLGAAGQTS